MEDRPDVHGRLFDQSQRARHDWIASGPRRGHEQAHATAVVTYQALPVRSRTVKACLTCSSVSADLDGEHGPARPLAEP